MNNNKINGIDVSECEYINCCSKKAKCIILQDDILSDSQYCESEPNCYFKQLKRLQEENKKLKDENSHKSNLIWYIYHCSKVETIQRLLYEYYECINDDRYNKKKSKEVLG